MSDSVPEGVAALRARFPESVVFAGKADDQFAGALARVAPGNTADFAPLDNTFWMVAGAESLTVWRDPESAGPDATIGWDRVPSFSTRPATVAGDHRYGQWPTLVIRVNADDGRVALVFPVLPDHGGQIIESFLDERAVNTLVERIDALAGDDVPDDPERAGSPRRVTLGHPTRHATLRWGSIVGAIAAAVFVVFLFAGLAPLGAAGVTTTHVIAVIAFVLLGVDVLVTALLTAVVTRRELLAGYTTAHFKYADLDEVDPVSGFVIRAAGEPMLWGRARDAALERVRSLR